MAKKICKEKECEACGAWFTPSRSNVKYCPNCRTHSDQIVRQYTTQYRPVWLWTKKQKDPKCLQRMRKNLYFISST